MEKMAQNVFQVASSPNSELHAKDVIFKVDSVLCDRKKANQIIDLLKGLLADSEKDVMMSVDCLQRIFTGYLNSEYLLQPGQLSGNIKDDSEAFSQYKVWLNDQYEETKTQFLLLCIHSRKSIQQAASEALISFVIVEDEKNTDSAPVPLLNQIVSNFLSNEHDMRHAIGVFEDMGLEHHLALNMLKLVLQSLKKRDKASGNDIYLLNVYTFLKINWIPKKESEDNIVHSLKKNYADAWVEFLKFQIPMSIYKRVLVDLHEKVLPNMKNPLILTDFLTESYNFGGGVSLLALNGLFFLIHKCNLEYPNFFEKLYALITEEVFHAKYRPQFFYLMDLFLSSIHVPSYLIAAYLKKLSRLCLGAPPDALLIILPFMKNLLIRHPNLKVLINRTDLTDVSSDPYLPEETCLSKCKAMESSLWEIKTLQHHWHPFVSKQAKFINKSLPTMETDLGDVLDTNYSQLFNLEMETETNEVPLSFNTPKGLFLRSEDKMCNWWT